MIDSAVTDLPLPDSPTRPSVSPGWISKLTSLTAGAGAGRAVSNTVVRLLDADSSGCVRHHRSSADFLILAEHRCASRRRSRRRVARASTAAMIGGTRLSPSRAASADRVERRAATRRRSRPARTRADALDLPPLDVGIDLEARRSRGRRRRVANRFTPTTTDSPASMACCAR